MKEKKLAEALKRGDAKALGSIIDAYSGYVCAVARNFSRGTLSEEDIDEISVDVFYNLWKCRENLDADIGLRPYLSAAARNALKNRFKKQNAPCEDISELELPDVFLVEQAAELHEMMECLNGGLEQLTDGEREIFFRYYFYGESSSQIAEKMGMAEGTVRAKLSRTRSRLKDHLAERGFSYV